MNPDEKAQVSTKDTRSYRQIDRVAYTGMGIYSFINLAWIIWALTSAGFGIFHTAMFIGIVIPSIGFLSLVVFQFSSRQNKFSALANVLSIFVIMGWFLAVWYIVVAASAAV